MSQPESPFRRLPPVDQLIVEFEGELPRPLLAATIRNLLDRARDQIATGAVVDVRAMLESHLRSVRRGRGVRVINASGVLLHTNLGRAAWSEGAIAAAAQAASGPVALELDLDSGERGARGGYVGDLLRALTGSEDALVVNNNAGAVLLALAATSPGRAVPVSRGELIEIGGSYRLPEVMKASGARLVEVGTTNRTRPDDYRTTLQLHDCGALLKVHPSNYRVTGFTEEATVGDLSALATGAGIPLIHDIGSGLLDSKAAWLGTPVPPWLEAEPGARQSLLEGADLVTFSGDKLLGGPQAGIVVGSAGAVSLLRSHPLARALRVDGVTLAALAATLECYTEGGPLQIPFWSQALAPDDEVARRAGEIAAHLAGRVVPGSSRVGAGSAPGASIPTTLVWLEGEDHLYQALLAQPTPVLARRQEGALVLDPRTVTPADDTTLAEAVIRCR